MANSLNSLFSLFSLFLFGDFWVVNLRIEERVGSNGKREERELVSPLPTQSSSRWKKKLPRRRRKTSQEKETRQIRKIYGRREWKNEQRPKKRERKSKGGEIFVAFFSFPEGSLADLFGGVTVDRNAHKLHNKKNNWECWCVRGESSSDSSGDGISSIPSCGAILFSPLSLVEMMQERRREKMKKSQW